jgi:putative hemolysin
MAALSPIEEETPMSQELTYLLWSAALASVYMLAQAAAYCFETGVKATNSTRDSGYFRFRPCADVRRYSVMRFT